MKKQDIINQDELYFTIKEVSAQIGVVPATIRNWEKHGLFSAKRATNGYRVYTIDDVENLRDIKRHSKDEGMGINAIRKFYPKHTSPSLMQKPPQKTQISKKFLSQKWKDYREQYGYILDDVAKGVGISSSYLSKIENGQANVSFDILQRLALFYGENILYYIRDDAKETPIIRKDKGEVFDIGLEGVAIESMMALKRQTISPMIYTAEPGRGRFEPKSHSGEEFVHILAGKIRITVGEQEYIMKKGDSMCYRSTEPHSWHNCGKTIAKILWVYTPLVKD